MSSLTSFTFNVRYIPYSRTGFRMVFSFVFILVFHLPIESMLTKIIQKYLCIHQMVSLCCVLMKEKTKNYSASPITMIIFPCCCSFDRLWSLFHHSRFIYYCCKLQTVHTFLLPVFHQNITNMLHIFIVSNFVLPSYWSSLMQRKWS